jgi:phosphonate transport system ATP-binding protein
MERHHGEAVMEWAVEVENVSKTFDKGLKALDGVSFKTKPGEMVALIGASGSGKSTLLRHISGLCPSDKTDSAIRVLGQCVQKRGHITRDVRKIRSRVGFIFQQFNLVGRLPVLTNVLVGILSKTPKWRTLLRIFTKPEKLAAMEALSRVDIADKALQRSSTLSGGQQQRAAIARALVHRSKVILADEPIASLDPESSRKVMSVLHKINREDEVTVLVSLHQVEYAFRFCDRAIALKNGRVIFDGPSDAISMDMLREIYGAKFGETGIEEGDKTAGKRAAPSRSVPAGAPSPALGDDHESSSPDLVGIRN